MAVNLKPPRAEDLWPVSGIELGFAEAGLRKANRRDLMLMQIAPGARIAGVFTQNSFAAAPVVVCRRHLGFGQNVRALVVNAGNANCGTGARGIDAALRSCAAAARLMDCEPSAVLPFSTGVILEHLPVERIEAALPRCLESMGASRWAEAASAIMTTDTVPKAASRRITIAGEPVTVTGIAKGVGMLCPNMATMLAFIATDAAVDGAVLARMVKEVADVSFNRVSVDGDTSTNDSFVLIATARAHLPEISVSTDPSYQTLRAAVIEVAQQLAQAIARDGEGATKFMTVEVNGTRNEEEAVAIAKSIAHSPLVKTAFFASDPNLGRLLMAIGNAQVEDLDTAGVDLFLGPVKVIERGERAAGYEEAAAARVMQENEIVIRVELNRGPAGTTVWTCDFSYDYVKINAEYRT